MGDGFARIKELSPAQRDRLLERLAQSARTAPPPLVRRPTSDAPPLSFAQERQFFLDRLNPGDPAFTIPGALRLTGDLSIPALEASVAALLRRHATLRGNFSAPGGEPVQTIRAPEPVTIPLVDLSTLAENARESEAQRLYAEDVVRGFDLARDPLLRLKLLRLGLRDHVLLITMHHIVSDGWSIGILLEELAALYAAFAAGSEPGLPDLPVSYADFAVWQREAMRDALPRQLAYWREQLASPPPVLALPADRLTHATAIRGGRDLAGASRERTIGPGLKRALETLGRQHDGTLFVVLLTAFMALLMRLTGREDVLIGSPVSGRVRVETEGLIGLFLNTLPLRARLPAQATFRDALAAVRRCVLDGLAHHDVPLERVVQEIAPERSAGAHPLFETFFNFTPSPPRRLDLPDLIATFEPPRGMRSEFPLTLYATEWQGMLELRAHYQVARYTAERMEALLEQLDAVLRQAVENPDRRLGDFDLVTEGARHVLPDPAAPLASLLQTPVSAAIAGWAVETPDAPALVQGARVLSYGVFAAAVDALAARLCAAGLARGETVAVRGPRCPGTIVGMAAVLRAGGVLMTLSLDLPELRQRDMLRIGRARFMLQVGADDGSLPDLPLTVIPVSTDGEADDAPGNLALPQPDGEAPAYLFFTSGSTGVPKAVRGTHAGLAHFLAWQRTEFAVDLGDRCAQLTGLSFDVVLRDVFLPLTSGAALVLPPADMPAASSEMLGWLERERITLVHTVPSVAAEWLRNPPPGAALAALKRIFFAGEPLTAALAARWRAAFPAAGDIVNLYGPTETSLAKAFYRVPPDPLAGIQPLGCALPQTQLLVLTPERRLCGIGEPGEIAVRTPFRSLGYLDNADETARRFVANPFRDDAGDLVYLTGDRGAYAADGTLTFLGRLDDQVKLRGVRVEPAEVAAVLQTSPDVAACAVIARDDGDAPLLVAYVVPRPGAGANAPHLRAFLQQRLPAALVPSAFVFLDRLPLNANQKLDRGRLPPPDRMHRTDAVTSAPRDPTELRLLQIWEELLDLRPIGVDDNFFDIGGHSLLALRLLVRIEQALGVKLPLAALFEGPTVAQLAARVRKAAPNPSQIVPLWTRRGGPALFLVHSGGGSVLNYVPLVRTLAPAVPVYGIQAQGLDGGGEPARSLPQLAAHYIGLIRTIAPQGPYLLGGHSLGGLIAYEMAQQLDACGDPVGLLALFDTRLAGEDDAPDARVLTDAAKTIGQFLGREVALSPGELVDLPADAQIARVLAALDRADALGFDGAAALVRNLLDVSRAHLAARQAYRPQPSQVSVTLFRARERAANFDAALGWDGLAPVRVLDADGGHVDMLQEPHVRALAAKFAICLNEALHT